MDCGHVTDFGSLHIASEADTIEGNTFQREMLKPDWITPLFLIKPHWAKLPQNLCPSQERLTSHHNLSPAVDDFPLTTFPVSNSTLIPLAFRRGYLRWKKLPSPVPPFSGPFELLDRHDSCVFFLRSRSLGSRARSTMILCQWRRRTHFPGAIDEELLRIMTWALEELSSDPAEPEWSQLDKLLLNKPFCTTAKITGKA